MAFELIVASPAEADIASAFVWYEGKGLNLGVDFVRCVDVTLARVQRSPLMFPVKYGAYRQAMVPRFPYAVYFIANEEQKFVSVQAVLHFSQDVPSYLKER